ncbi:MAG TPA: PEP/pyruvate-binding domain-containing protein [Verrucomicrobiae bacterium]
MQGVIRFIGVVLFSISAHAISSTLELVGWETNGWPQVAIGAPANLVYSLQSSSNLTDWSTIAVLHGREFATNEPTLPFIDASAPVGGTRFYCYIAEPIEFDDDWRNQVYFPDDDFRSEPISFGLPEPRWIKFGILTNEPKRVYYQNSWKYKFHYNFASARLPGFKGLNSIQFDEVSLQTNSQRIVLGAVLFSPRPEDREAGIQFVGRDPYAPEQIARWFEIVRSTIQPLGQLNVVYLPTFEQTAVAQNHREFFAARGIEIGSLTDWDTGANAYSLGWAIGRLVFVPGAQIQQAYANGTLRPTDILLTDAVPVEVPYVAGILTLAPSTPNSHVTILARSYSIPFVYLAEPELRSLAQSLVGREVALTAFPGYPAVSIRLFDVSNIDPNLRSELVEAKMPPPLAITPKARFGAYTAPTENLVPSDIKYFGGKAANFGFLRRQLPTNSPAAIAIPFDLWDDFMSQTNVNSRSLRDEIASRLNKYTHPPNVAALADELATIRDLIEDQTLFTPAQQQAIAAALLAKFEPQTKIRFRSSTNVEDAENFTGAGLYDSYSGCLADDQDGDTAGPSTCDSTEEKERGVFRAIRKVYASFYNDNAVLERMRHRVDETKVGMAILVHYSAPDPTELANGVATISYIRTGTTHSYTGKMVTQKGAVSVTNPDGSALPEVVSLSRFTGSPHFSVQQYSSLVPFGANVLAWESEYASFAQHFARTATAFNGYYSNKARFTLDFEYKKLQPGVLQVKQVREIPSPDPQSTIPTYLLTEPGEWRIFQGEFGNVFANHRLKSKFLLTTRDLKLTTNSIRDPIITQAAIEYLQDGEVRTLAGAPTTFSNAVYKVGTAEPDGVPLIHSWTTTTSNNLLRASLSTKLRLTATPEQSPLLTLRDAHLELSVTYSNPVPELDHQKQLTYSTNDFVWLTPPQTTNAQSIPVTRTVAKDRATITTSFFWPQPPAGFTAGYTAPLIAWKETRIEGLTAEPILLRNYYSQTYRPEHHNFAENFLFEPALEPGISAAILEELRAKNIRQIYVYWGGGDSESAIYVAGENGTFRLL